MLDWDKRDTKCIPVGCVPPTQLAYLVVSKGVYQTSPDADPLPLDADIPLWTDTHLWKQPWKTSFARGVKTGIIDKLDVIFIHF